MTKYIHYLKLHLPNILISDNIDESKSGYTLGLEISCNCFDAVLDSMKVSRIEPLVIRNNVVTNENLFGFKRKFMNEMDVVEKFSNEDYTVREFKGEYVTLFTKKVLPAASSTEKTETRRHGD